MLENLHMHTLLVIQSGKHSHNYEQLGYVPQGRMLLKGWSLDRDFHHSHSFLGCESSERRSLFH